MTQGIDRREFLRAGLAASAVLGLPGAAAAAEPGAPSVRRYARLGRTGLEIADISFGSSRLSGDEALVRHALDRGVNYFDTAESYRSGASEETLGRALAGERDRVLIASKVACKSSTSRDELMRSLEGSLRRLRTDRVDVYFNHAVNDVSRLENSEWAEFATRAKEQGKLRFTGMSGHGGRLDDCLDFALDHDLFDVLLVGYNFGQDPAFYSKLLRPFDFVAIQPELPRLLAKAKKKDVGVIAMKTLMGGRLNDLRPFEFGGATFAQAAFRWALSSPNVDALIVSMTDTALVDEYLGASGAKRAAWSDPRLLERYWSRNTESYCRPGCDDCLQACPHGVQVSDVLRARMYANDYRDPELAQASYAAIETGASACLGCAHQACAGACTYGVPIAKLTAPTHRLLHRS